MVAQLVLSVPAEMTETFHDAQSRARVSRACTSCASLRKRCTGEVPCPNCVKRGIECVYTTAKLPGPKPGAKTEHLKEELERAEAELRAIKRHFGLREDLPFCPPEDRSDVVSGRSAGATTPPASVSSGSSGIGAKRRRTEAATHGGGRSGAGAAAGADDQGASSDSSGPSSSNGGRSTAAPSAAAPVAGRREGSDARLDAWKPPAAIIPTAEESALLRSFFEQSNAVMPVVDEDSFKVRS